MVAYSFKSMFIAPIRAGLGIKHLNERGKVVIPGALPKLQTIRADRKRHARPGEELQLYYAMRTKSCFLIGRARCTKVSPIELWLGAGDELGVSIAGDYFCGTTRIREFAQSDGFADAAAMIAFWREEHESIDHFEGVLIEWEPLEGTG
jgi:hypothetical protein